MTRAMLLMLGFAVVGPRAARAQLCTPPEHPYFEYQVERPARFTGDTAVRPRPIAPGRSLSDQKANPPTLLVSFVVDSLGAIDSRSIHLLRSPSKDATAAVIAAVPSWTFKPAMASGCRVAQLVMVEVER
jgi:hypothetical protein